MQNTQLRGPTVAAGEGTSWRRLPLAASLAALLAALANTLVYLAATGLGFIPRDVLVSTPGGEQPLGLAPVVASSAAGVVGAALVFALIGLLSRRPVKVFRLLATGVLVLSFVMPLTISGAPLAMILSLEAMHVVAWAAAVGLLTTLARRTQPEGAQR